MRNGVFLIIFSCDRHFTVHCDSRVNVRKTEFTGMQYQECKKTNLEIPGNTSREV